MRKPFILLMLSLFIALFGAAVISAQDATQTPDPLLQVTLPLPTIEITICVTSNPTNAPTSAATQAPTNVATTVATTIATTMATTAATTAPSGATAQATAQPTLQPNMEMTAEVAVAPEVEMTPVANGALMRVGYFATDQENVDVYIDNVLLFKDLKYPSVSKLIAVEPGTHSVIVSWTGHPVSDSVIDINVSVSAGTAQTVAIIGSSDNITLNTALISEDYSDLLPGTGGFTFFNAVRNSPAVNVDRDTIVYFAQIEYPSADSTTTSSSVHVDAGTFDISVSSADDPTMTLAERSDLSLPENAFTLVVLVGTEDDTRLFTVVTDAADVAIARGDLPKPGMLIDALNANENLTGFADALNNAGLNDMLTGMDHYTIFAPANYVTDDNMPDLSAYTLSSYIVEGKYTSQELIAAGTLTAIDGTTLTITTSDNAILVNGVELIDVNIPATNGVIHMLGGAWNGDMTGANG